MLIDHPALIRKREVPYGYPGGENVGYTLESPPSSQAFVPSLDYSQPQCVCPNGAFLHWKFVQQLTSLSLPSTHCSRKRPRITATPLGLHISPASMGTLLPVIHTLFHAAFPDPNSGLNSQEEEDPVQRWGGWAEMSG